MLKLDLNPTEKHLSNIEDWLIEEWNNSKNGFYSNWTMITNAFADNRLSIISEKNFAIGFVVYRINNLIATIDIAEVKPSHRNKGIGEEMISKKLENFKSLGILVTQLFCSPEKSESFWKKANFYNFPKIRNLSKDWMYKSLVPTINNSKKINSDETIELWNEEPHEAGKLNPKWIWNLNFKSNSRELIKPIIFPVFHDWQICWKKGGKIVEIDKVKYYRNNGILFGNFIVIKSVI